MVLWVFWWVVTKEMPRQQAAQIAAVTKLADTFTSEISGERAAHAKATQELADKFTAELERERVWQERVAGFKAQLVDGPVLVIPLVDMSVQFNPSTLVPLGDAGTVYPTLRIADRWGILTVGGAALLAGDWSTVRVEVTDPGSLASLSVVADQPRKLAAEGWTLELSPGWRVVAGERKGDWALTSAS